LLICSWASQSNSLAMEVTLWWWDICSIQQHVCAHKKAPPFSLFMKRVFLFIRFSPWLNCSLPLSVESWLSLTVLPWLLLRIASSSSCIPLRDEEELLLLSSWFRITLECCLLLELRLLLSLASALSAFVRKRTIEATDKREENSSLYTTLYTSRDDVRGVLSMTKLVPLTKNWKLNPKP
jgi:hypothetical protein